MQNLVMAGLCLIAASGCQSTKTCTLIGCHDQFAARVTGSLPAGNHAVNVTADGMSSSCTFAVAPGGSAIGPECTGGLQVVVWFTQVDETIMVIGTPAEVRVQQSVDGALVLDRTSVPRYTSVFPNGP